jgi:beta-glucanase (GH16 family)
MNFDRMKRAPSRRVKYLGLSLLMMGVSSLALAGWEVQWIEPFDGTSVNWDNWTARVQADYNNEVQCYTDDDSSVDKNYDVSDGTLKIIARREAVSCEGLGGKSKTWTSGRLNSKDKAEFQYGRIEARIRFHDLEGGSWPAFWMLENRIGENPVKGDNDNVSWPNPGAGEIDVWEWFSNNPSTYITNFFNASGCGAEFRPSYSGGASDVQDFHTYAIEWTADDIQFFMNDTMVKSYDLSSCSQYEEPMFVLLNVAMGGNLGGAIDASLNTATMEVDYVAHCIASTNNALTSCNETTPFVTDDDGDGIGNQIDECPNTEMGTEVNYLGCVPDENNETGTGVTGPTAAAPTPELPGSYVISLFSDTYADISGIDYNPFWGQGTTVSQVQVEGNTTLKYENLNYQGTDFNPNHQNVSGMESLHIDFWSADATELSLYLISPGPVETPFELSITTEEWVSTDIPLTAFNPVDLTDTFQLKIVGNGTVFIDNIYFKAIGSSQDSDEDGVVDVIDACSDTSNDAIVDSIGCEINFAPTVALSMTQAGAAAIQAKTNGGRVVITAEVVDSNLGDSHSYTWSTNDDVSLVALGNEVSFNPSDLSAGEITIAVNVVDDGSPSLSVNKTIDVMVVETESPSSDQAGSSGILMIVVGVFLLMLRRGNRYF